MLGPASVIRALSKFRCVREARSSAFFVTTASVPTVRVRRDAYIVVT